MAAPVDLVRVQLADGEVVLLLQEVARGETWTARLQAAVRAALPGSDIKSGPYMDSGFLRVDRRAVSVVALTMRKDPMLARLAVRLELASRG